MFSGKLLLFLNIMRLKFSNYNSLSSGFCLMSKHNGVLIFKFYYIVIFICIPKRAV